MKTTRNIAKRKILSTLTPFSPIAHFLEMKKNNLIEPFAYIAFASSESKDVKEWLDKNQKQLDAFYEWSKNYKWNK